MEFTEDSNHFGYKRANMTVADGITSAPVFVDISFNYMSIAVLPVGSARIEFSICSVAEINADTATWWPWDLGNVTEDTLLTLVSAVTAIRLVSVSGAATCKVLAK